MSALRPVRGWIPPKRWPTREEMAAHHVRMSAATKVEQFVRTKLGTPTIKDQDISAECGGFGAVQGMHIRRQALGLPSELPSPTIPYWAARREVTPTDQEITDSGVDMDSLVEAANDFGACSWDLDPFDMARVNERPGDVAMTAAQQIHCIIEPIIATGPELWLAIQHAICIERKPVIVALMVVPAFDNAGRTGGVVDDPSGTSRGGHVNCLFESDPAAGAHSANSWGVGDWTSDGTAWLTPRFIAGAVEWAGALEIQI